MPVYEYYCRSCASTFEKLRPMRSAAGTAECPAGHAGATRTLSTFATLGRATEPDTGTTSAGGGCCGGGGCACGGMSRN